MDPNAVLAISQFIESLRDIDNISERPSGEVTIGLNIVNTLNTIMKNPTALAAIKDATGIAIEDKNKGHIPDTKKQIDTAFTFARKNGVPGQTETLSLDQAR